jgi:predicted helicase
MDSYIRAFRWASDRIVRNGDCGIVCYVSNAGWLRSTAGEGIRRAFVSEYNSIYVLDLRGNQRTQGEESRKEGGKVFGSGSRAPIAITMLVKNPNSDEHGVIHYVDVGDYKTRSEKLDFAANAATEDLEWTTLEPDSHGDWLNQRDESFYDLSPMGVIQGAKKTNRGLWTLWSMGNDTKRAAWVYNYSRKTLIKKCVSVSYPLCK